MIKREWIRYHKSTTKNDHIIFREEEDPVGDKIVAGQKND